MWSYYGMSGNVWIPAEAPTWLDGSCKSRMEEKLRDAKCGRHEVIVAVPVKRWIVPAPRLGLAAHHDSRRVPYTSSLYCPPWRAHTSRRARVADMASNQIPFSGEGRCALRGSCGTKGWFGKPLPCPYDGPPVDVRARIVSIACVIKS